MRMMPVIAVVAISAVAGCASANGSTARTTETTRIVGAGGTNTLSTSVNTSASVSSVSFPIDRVWRLLPSVYDSLGIHLTVADQSRHLIGNEGMKIRQRLKNVSLSNYIDCGEAQIGSSADSYDIFLSVTTTLTAVSPTETSIATTVESAGKPMTYAQEYSRCATKGTIETKIASIVAAKLAASTR